MNLQNGCQEKNHFFAPERNFSAGRFARKAPAFRVLSRLRIPPKDRRPRDRAVSFGILEKRKHINAAELGAPAEELELDDKSGARNGGAQLADQTDAASG